MDALNEANGLAAARDAMAKSEEKKVENHAYDLVRKVVEVESSWFHR